MVKDGEVTADRGLYARPGKIGKRKRKIGDQDIETQENGNLTDLSGRALRLPRLPQPACAPSAPLFRPILPVSMGNRPALGPVRDTLDDFR